LVLATAAFALAIASTVGCRSPHLGDDTGRAYRQAVVRQANADGESVPNLSATDAKNVLETHRDPRGERQAPMKATSFSSVTPAVTSSSSSSSGGSGNSGGGSWDGASGNIRIQAK
jgi:hypothetical protein